MTAARATIAPVTISQDALYDALDRVANLTVALADYAGIDIIQAPGGKFYVLEVNSMPAWNGLQRVARVRISDYLVDDFLDAALPKERLEGREGA